ncbi:MAG: hypothetical protein AAGB51_12140 [Planctomycetota bacterium]
MNRRRNAFLAAALIGCVAAPVSAQQITDAQITANSIGAGSSQEQAIRAFADRFSGDLTSADPALRARARRELLRPLTNTNATIAFRLAYSRVLSGALERAIAGGPETGIGALRIAGDLASPTGVQLIEQGLRNADSAVRFSAASSAGRTFQAIGRSQPAVSEESLARLAAALSRAIGSDSSAAVADASARALGEAAGIEIQGYDGVAPGATRAVLEGLASRLSDPELLAGPVDPLLYVAVARGLEIANNRISLANADNSTATLAANVAGHALGLVVRDLDDADSDTAAALSSLAGTSEAVVYWSAELLRPGSGQQFDLRNAAQRGAAPFRNAASGLIGTNGQLASAPFNLDPTAFQID